MKLIRALIGIVIALFLGVLIMGLLFPSITYNTETKVDTPAEFAFAVFTDSSHIREWQPNIVEFKHISGPHNAVGGIYRIIAEDDGERFEMQEEITGFRLDEFFSNTISNDVMDVYTEVSFKWMKNKTVITARTTVVGKSIWWRALFPFYRTYLSARAQEDYNRLREVIEQHY